jgi:hypothetical protein
VRIGKNICTYQITTIELTTVHAGRSLLPVNGGQTACDGELKACKTTLACLRQTGGDPPSFHAIEIALRHMGVARPEEPVLAARDLSYLSFEGRLTGSSAISLSLAGHYLADPHDPLLHHYFIRVIRSLVDRPDRETLLSLTESRPVVVFANEMEQLRAASPMDVKMLGRFLDVDAIGVVEWFEDDPSCPWSIRIDYTIRDFANVASIPDCLEVLKWRQL